MVTFLDIKHDEGLLMKITVEGRVGRNKAPGRQKKHCKITLSDIGYLSVQDSRCNAVPTAVLKRLAKAMTNENPQC